VGDGQADHALREAVHSALSAGRSVEAFRTLSRLLVAQREMRTRLLRSPLEVLARTRDELAELSQARTPTEVLTAAPAALCRACGFDRASISTVNGSIWTPVALHVETSPCSPVNVLLAQAVKDCEIPLTSAMPEAELVRRRSPVLVPRAQADARLYRPLVELSNTPEYIAAPIQAGGDVLGLLHADCHDSRRTLTTLDRDRLQRFADGVGWVIERMVARERLTLQQDRVHRVASAVEAVVRERPMVPLAFGAAPGVGETQPATAPGGQPSTTLDRLTPRESEVMQLLLGGASNAEIANRLTVSETTVKSHVRHILRKLQASNRAQAIARYLCLTKRQVRRS